MSNFDIVLNELKQEINNLPEMKEYFSMKNKIQNNKEILILDRELREHQKAMCKSKNNDAIYNQEKQEYERCLDLLNKNPLYQNYLSAKEEAINLLNEIKEQLQ